VTTARVLYPFRYRDPNTGKWIGARYRASLEDVAARYAEWELIGQPEYRTGDGQMFSPFRRLGYEEALEIEPVVDRSDAWLVACFLRRYVTWCACTKRFRPMQGAARLLSIFTLAAAAPDRPRTSCSRGGALALVDFRLE
jgi:hypothetical protein